MTQGARTDFDLPFFLYDRFQRINPRQVDRRWAITPLCPSRLCSVHLLPLSRIQGIHLRKVCRHDRCHVFFGHSHISDCEEKGY